MVDDASGTNLLFVTGVFRSGTSLLYTSLNQHPQIGLMYEPELQSHDLPDRWFLHRKWLENANAWGKFLGRHGFPPFPAEARSSYRRPSDFYRDFAARKGARYGGEKSPSLVNYLPELHQRFPEARFISISRHPLSVYASVRHAGRTDAWFARRGMMARMLAGQEKLLADSFALQRRGARMLHLTYEEFTGDPTAECRRICEFLGIEFDPVMISLKEANLGAVYDGEHHQKLRSGAIASTPPAEAGLGDDWRAALEAHWGRTRAALDDLRAGRLAGDRPSMPPGLVAPAVRQGVWWHRLTRWKRRLYHVAPSELVHALRAMKVLLKESRITTEDAGPGWHRTRVGVALAVVALISFGFGVWCCLHGRATLSPLPFFIVPPLLAGWFLGGRAMVLHAGLAALVWSVVPKLSFAEDQPIAWILWNVVSRTVVLSLLGFFAWHLKATLLQHQKTQRY